MASFSTEAVSSSTREKPKIFALPSACSNNRRPSPLPRALEARYIFLISQMLADVACSPTEPTTCPFAFTRTSNSPPLLTYSASMSLGLHRLRPDLQQAHIQQAHQTQGSRLPHDRRSWQGVRYNSSLG